MEHRVKLCRRFSLSCRLFDAVSFGMHGVMLDTASSEKSDHLKEALLIHLFVFLKALAMVEEETRRYRPTKNYLEHIPPLNLSAFETEIMRSEFERMQQRLPMDVLSMKRYELPPPPAGKMTDIAAWTECVENSLAQLEHQATRICNLELMVEYGCEAWKSYLEVLVQLVTQAQKQLTTMRKQIQEINWQRKNMQTQGGDKLRNLESSWVGLVSKNYEIEQACAQLEKEVARLKAEKKIKNL
uniref:Pre-mRNA-splicing factor SPF27 n=2 Tax=Timema TaxID=61471 RepID=A0A7R9G0F5_TIMSH|nr:unnamed protein product [Timema shepardi]CAD7572361.1 unnamed protein product [Timema californicum]